MVLTLERDQHSVLPERARREANEGYSQRLAAREPVTASYAALPGCMPKEVLGVYRGVKEFTVFPDDTVEPTGRSTQAMPCHNMMVGWVSVWCRFRLPHTPEGMFN